MTLNFLLFSYRTAAVILAYGEVLLGRANVSFAAAQLGVAKESIAFLAQGFARRILRVAPCD
jgi:hypothetical protein